MFTELLFLNLATYCVSYMCSVMWQLWGVHICTPQRPRDSVAVNKCFFQPQNILHQTTIHLNLWFFSVLLCSTRFLGDIVFAFTDFCYLHALTSCWWLWTGVKPVPLLEINEDFIWSHSLFFPFSFGWQIFPASSHKSAAEHILDQTEF